MKNIIKSLKRHRKLLEELAPCGCTPEEAWKDKYVVVNAPRALLIYAFKAQVQLLFKLEKEGKIK